MSTEAVLQPTATPAPTDSPDKIDRALAVWQRVDAWLELASDYLNPILVKETRQALKSRQFVLWFLLLLAACWIVTIGGVAIIGPSIYYASSGDSFYYAYYVVLAFPLTVVVPFTAYRSLAAEQEENTRDLLMVSALSPRQIINGKLGSAVLQMVVYFSALSPCLAFTYLLRGVDLVTVVLLPAYAFLTSLFMSMLGLASASFTRRKYGQVMLSIGFVVALLAVFGWLLSGTAELIQGGFRYFQDKDFWVANLVALTFYVTTFLLLYFAAAGLNTFTAANRSTPLRVVLFIKQACAMGWLVYFWRETEYEPEAPIFGAIVMGVGWFFATSLMTGEGPVLSNRVRRTLPETTVARMLASWFNPGPGAGYVFGVASWVAVALSVAMLISVSSSVRTGNYLWFLALATSYAVIFLGIGRLVIIGLRKFVEVTMLGCGLIHFLIVLGASASPLLIQTWFNGPRPRGFVSYYTISPLATLAMQLAGRISGADLNMVLLVVPGIALCVLLVCLLHAGREARQTRTAIPSRVIEDELELHPLPQPAVKNPWGDT